MASTPTVEAIYALRVKLTPRTWRQVKREALALEIEQSDIPARRAYTDLMKYVETLERADREGVLPED